MAGIAVRDVDVEDLAVVADVFRRSSLANEGDRANLLAHPELLEWAQDPADHGHTRVAVAEGRVVGFATTVIQSESQSLELDDLFVDPDSMRRGVGRALVVDAVARAQALGLPRITVSANTHALGFYERAGFVVTGVAQTLFARVPRMVLEVAPAR